MINWMMIAPDTGSKYAKTWAFIEIPENVFYENS